MAHAWILAPLPAVATAAYGTVQAGMLAYALNDYAGVIFRQACDNGGNSALSVFDLGGDQLVDTVMVFGVDRLPAGAQFNVQLKNSAGAVVAQSDGDVYCGTAPMSSGKGVSLWTLAVPVPARTVSLNYIAAGQAVEFSRVVIGRRIQLERNFGYGAAFGVKDLGSLDFTRRGILQRARGKKLRTVGLTFSNVFKDEVEAQTQPLLERVGNTEMVALVTDPSPDALRQNRCYFGPLVGDLGHTWRKARLFEAKANMVSIF